MKILLAAGAAGGCVLIGLMMARRLVRRENAIAAWIRLVDGLLARISYVDDALCDVLASVASSDVGGGLSDAIAQAARLMSADRALSFSEALNHDDALANLSESDAAPLIPLIGELGATARPQQIARLQSARASLAAASSTAAEQTVRQKRLYMSLGTLGGLALFLLLI